MKVTTAQLAGDGGFNADRVLVTDQAVIVLDGASAFEPDDVDPGDYAQVLGDVIADQLTAAPATLIPDAVAVAIRTAVRRLRLSPSRSPSSTVSILRTHDEAVDLYVLGDSPIVYGIGDATRVLLDDRLSTVAQVYRGHYINALRAGQGFDAYHREALADLQRAERMSRNHEHGYWIAETDPDAAHHGLTTTLPRTAITWAVLATDGAADLIDHLGHPWPDIAHRDHGHLAALLNELHQWETDTDPDGRQLPRAKRHDDKTLAAVLL